MSDVGYLTIARVLDTELEKYMKANVPSLATGFEQIYAEQAFKAGFFKGVELKLTKEENK